MEKEKGKNTQIEIVLESVGTSRVMMGKNKTTQYIGREEGREEGSGQGEVKVRQAAT